ncbi:MULTISPECIES: hypothetical protein [Kitasatospora]|uniref:Uncharacterized protein n=1 Tax=Kitasatospora setae (strain ATCC 33774 / DSM 43861 / JCM 3304 / KCC A-0304 / NBRC 14216 / KM-6054) TaxID=452652 RepID=E4NCJ1_KITSK|nr:MULTISPECIES: hypothetical protein [Kitasatospora]BAJ28922.1 hypothetical protein KSE_31120 [Kitasatospora setae KM-6054]
MTRNRRPAGRDALHALWMLALELPLLIAFPYLFMAVMMGFAVADDPTIGGPDGRAGAGVGMLVVGLLLLALWAGAIVLGVRAAVRRGFRIAPAVLSAGPGLLVLVALLTLVRH